MVVYCAVACFHASICAVRGGTCAVHNSICVVHDSICAVIQALGLLSVPSCSYTGHGSGKDGTSPGHGSGKDGPFLGFGISYRFRGIPLNPGLILESWHDCKAIQSRSRVESLVPLVD